MARHTFEKVLKDDEKITLEIFSDIEKLNPTECNIAESFGKLKVKYFTAPANLKRLGFFNIIKGRYSPRFLSLQNLELEDFSMDKKKISWYTINSKYHKSGFRFKSGDSKTKSLSEVLKIFQFFINCEICFKKLSLRHERARKVNRGDIMGICEYDLSNLTSVNSFEVLI